MSNLTFTIVTLQPAKKYVPLFTAFKCNKSSANSDIQRQECHSSLSSPVKVVNQKPFLSSILPSENLSRFFLRFLVLISTMYSPENLSSRTSELLYHAVFVESLRDWAQF